MKKTDAKIFPFPALLISCIIAVLFFFGIGNVAAAGPDSAPSSNCWLHINDKPWQNSLPLKVWFTASDDNGLSSVALYYRYSPDNSDWQSWTEYTNYPVPASTRWQYYLEFSFPNGEGYYQFYTVARDNTGQIESPPAAPDLNAGYDITPPQIPASPATETHGVRHNIWQTAITAPAFTWQPPPDNLSGVHNYDYYWGTDRNSIPFYYSCRGSFESGQLNEGVIQYLQVRAVDDAGNRSDWVRMFVFKYGPFLYVDDDWSGLNPGDPAGTHTFGEDAYAGIQDAIDEVANGGTIRVAGGHYPGNVIMEHLPSAEKKAVTIEGGYSPDFKARDPSAYPSVVDGLGAGNSISILSSSKSVIRGLTVTGSGRGEAGIYIEKSDDVVIENNKIQANPGPGIEFLNSDRCTVKNNIISNNVAGIYTEDIAESVISSNEISNNENGIVVYSGSPTIRENILSNNSDNGILGNQGYADVRNNTISNNGNDGIRGFRDNGGLIEGNFILGNIGWGIRFFGLGDVRNNLVAGNHLGGINIDHVARVINNTSAFNTNGGGLEIGSYWQSSVVVNNIIWGNRPQDVPDGARADYSDIGTGRVTGNGNISLDPRFSGPGNDDYSLQHNSPCMDGGTNAWPSVSMPTVDIIGNPRPFDGDGNGTATIDIGAYEFLPALVSIDISPDSPSVIAGASQQFKAVGTFSNNTQLDITVYAAWTSSNPAIATIGINTGLAGALSPGSTTITVGKDGITASTLLTVTSPQSPPPGNTGSGGGSGGGGGGGGAAGVLGLSDIIDPTGRLLVETRAISVGAEAYIILPKNTLCTSTFGGPIFWISILPLAENEAAPPSPQDTAFVSDCFQLGPDYAEFEPPVKLIFNINTDEIPEGFSANDLYIATWDEENQQWLKLDSVADPDTGSIEVEISHFSIYSVMAARQSARFDLSGFTVNPSRIEVGQPVTAAVLVTNSGGRSGSYRVALELNNVEVKAEEVVIEANSSRRVSFTYIPSSAGKYRLGIGESIAEIEVVAPPAPASFHLSEFNISGNKVNPGQSVAVNCVITNDGEMPGSHDVVLYIDGTPVTRTVSLDGGESQIVSFVIPAVAEGKYTLTIESWSQTFEVVQASPQTTETSPSTTMAQPGINTPPFTGITGGLSPEENGGFFRWWHWLILSFVVAGIALYIFKRKSPPVEFVFIRRLPYISIHQKKPKREKRRTIRLR